MKTKTKILSVLLILSSGFFSNTYASYSKKIIKTPYKIKVKIKNTACTNPQIKTIEKDIFDISEINCDYGCQKDSDKIVCMGNTNGTTNTGEGHLVKDENDRDGDGNTNELIIDNNGKYVFGFFLKINEDSFDKKEEAVLNRLFGDLVDKNAIVNAYNSKYSDKYFGRIESISREKYKENGTNNCGNNYTYCGNEGWYNDSSKGRNYLKKGFREPVYLKEDLDFSDFGSVYPFLQGDNIIEYSDISTCISDKPTTKYLQANLITTDSIILEYSGVDDDGVRKFELYRDGAKISDLVAGDGETYLDDDNGNLLDSDTEYNYELKFQAKNASTGLWEDISISKTFRTEIETYCGDGIKQDPNDNGEYEQCDNGTSNGPNNICTNTCQKETVKPEGTISYGTGWVSQNEVITITSSDEQSGVKEIKLYKSIDNGSSWNLFDTLNSGENGNTNFQNDDYAKNIKYKIIIEDNAGNFSDDIIGGVLKFDNISPNGDINYQEKYTDGDSIKWINSNLKIDFTNIDDGIGSGIKTLELCKNGLSCENIDLSSINSGSGTINKTFTESDNGDTVYYEIKITDNVDFEKNTNFSKSLKIDTKKPEGTINYLTGVTNDTNIDIEFSLEDTESGIFNDYKLVEYTDGNITNSNVGYTCSTDTNNNKVCKYTKTFNSSDLGKKFKYSIEGLKDNVGNNGDNIIGGETIYDDGSGISCSATLSSSNFVKANDNQEITITCNDTVGGSNINYIESKFENVDDENIFNSEKYSNSDSLTIYENISKVDNFKENGNFRKYTLKITKVCNDIGICKEDIKTFTYFVYADLIDLSKSSVDLGDLISGNLVANGTESSLKIILKDKYGNAISPVKYNYNNRRISLAFDYKNDLYLDHYKQEGKGVFINDTALDFGSSQTEHVYGEFGNTDNDNGIYKINFKSYSPTYKSGATDGRQFLQSKFVLNKIVGILRDKTPIEGDETFASPEYEIMKEDIDIQFKPMYKASFSGSIKESGFIEGENQKSQIIVSNYGTRSASDKKIFFEFTDPNQTSTKNLLDNLDLAFQKGDGEYDIDNQTEIFEKTLTNNLDFDNSLSKLDFSNIGIIKILTLLTQKLGTTIENVQETRLSTYMKYNLDGKEIIYPQDFIGGALKQKTKQTGLNVIGYISNSINYILKGSEGRDLNNIGNLKKLDFKKAIEKNIFKALKSENLNNGTYKIVDLSNWESSQTDGRKMNNNSILYFKGGDSNGLITLDNGTVENTIKIKGKKTIIIIGADLYIRNNMYYEDKNKDILGIIVLKDEMGKGGNIYIDPSVTNIVGTLYLSRTLQSGELDGTTMKQFTSVNDGGKLKNQLHIFGNIFSENTIGGAKSNPLVCPYFETDCSAENAQKYDLNFLRRFVLVYKETNNVTATEKILYIPRDGAKVIGNGICKYDDLDGDEQDDDGIIECDGDSKFARSIKNTDDPYAKQSVIIEYNSNLLNNMPPLFKQ